MSHDDGQYDGTRTLAAVPSSEDFRERILKIPTRVWTVEEGEELADQLTPLLKTDKGTWKLNYMQAIGLKEAHENEGLAMSAPVGKGKGLLSLLLPGWMESRRGIIIVPAHLRERTLKKMLPEALSNWKLHPDLVYRPEEVIHSSQTFQTLKNKNLFFDLDPDDIVIDEQQYWKNDKSTRTGRLIDYLKARAKDGRPVRVHFMTGSFFSYSVLDIYTLYKWALPKSFFFPIHRNHAKTWAAALDENVKTRALPGALSMFMTRDQREKVESEEVTSEEKVDVARDAFSTRLGKMPGVVLIQDASVNVSLCYDLMHPDRKDYPQAPEVIRDAFTKLRTLAALPGDEWISDGTSLWRACRELSVGFYNIWDWKKSVEADEKKLWCDRRKRWKKCIRQTIKKHREAGLDSELAVTIAARNGVIDTSVVVDNIEYEDSYGDWMNRDGAMRAPGPDMQPPTKAVWMSDFLVDWLYEQTKDEPTVIWVEHPVIGKRLEEKYGIKYYGAGARTVERETGKKTICCSMMAQGTGNNMQMFHRAIIVSPPKSATLNEQVVGREHRHGQKDDCFVLVLLNCLELWQGWNKAIALANFQSHLQGQQKLMYGDRINEPSPEQVKRWMKGQDPQWAEPQGSALDELDGIIADMEDEETK